ncbi:nucleotidyltransferase domain-containing protein [Patescibacteria group bacterium]
MRLNNKVIRNSKILETIIKKIESDFANDVSVLVCYGSYVKGNIHKYSDIDFFFIPRTEKGYRLSYQFIIKGVGYDLWPVSWDRAERISKLEGPLQSIFLDGKVVYFSTDKELQRYKNLLATLKTNIRNKTAPILSPDLKIKEKKDKKTQPDSKILIGFYEELKSIYNKLKLACETENIDLAAYSAKIIDKETQVTLNALAGETKFPSLSESVLSKDFKKISIDNCAHEKTLRRLLRNMNIPLNIFKTEEEFKKAFNQRI